MKIKDPKKTRHWNFVREVAERVFGWREDAHETAVLARQLDFVQAQAYEVEYTALRAEDFIPVDTSVPVGAASFTYRVWDRFGYAKIIRDYANDFERVGVFAREVTQKPVDVGDFYEYSVRDLERAAFGNIPLDAQLGKAVRLAMELAMDNIAALGDPETGMPGFVNHENVPMVTLPNGDWQNPSTTAEEILEDLRYLASRPFVTTKQVRSADTMLLDTESFELVAGRAVGQNLDRTILDVFLATQRHIRNVDSWTKLDTANADGDGPRIMVYQRNADVVRLVIPQRFTQLPMQQLAAMFRTYCLGAIGGTSWRIPLAAAMADNAAA